MRVAIPLGKRQLSTDGQICKTAKTHSPVRDLSRIPSCNSASFVRTFSNHANDIAGFDLCKKVEIVAEYGSQDSELHGWSPVDFRFDIICKISASFAVLREEMSTVPRFIPSFSRILKLGQNLHWAMILFSSDTLALFGWVGRNLESDGVPRVIKRWNRFAMGAMPLHDLPRS